MGRVAVLFLLVSCGQGFNSNSFDEQKYRSTLDTSTPAGQRFADAYAVIQNNCINCHSGRHDNYSFYKTSDDWINNGLINAGDFENSFIIRRLKNFGGDMPQGGSNLSDDEIESLQDWIDNL